jgi:capsular polysaccharide biosynthesis protein
MSKQKFLSDLETVISNTKVLQKKVDEVGDIESHAAFSGALTAFTTCKEKFIEIVMNDKTEREKIIRECANHVAVYDVKCADMIMELLAKNNLSLPNNCLSTKDGVCNLPVGSCVMCNKKQ